MQSLLGSRPKAHTSPSTRPRRLASFPYLDHIYHFRTINRRSGNVHCCILNARLQSCGYEDTHIRTWSDVSVVAAERHPTSKTRNTASHRCRHWLPWGRLWCEPQAAGYEMGGSVNRVSQPCNGRRAYFGPTYVEASIFFPSKMSCVVTTLNLL